KLFYLFFGIIIISSCASDNFIEKQAETTTSEIVHEKLTYQQASKAINNQPAFDEKLKNSFHDNFNLLSNNLNKTTNSTEESTEILIDYFFDPNDDSETYSFITQEFTGTEENDYLEKFVLTVEEGEQKVGYLRYYPTTDFETENFTGKIEISNLDRSQIDETYLENGIVINKQTNGIQDDCTTTFVITYHTCSHGGGHWIGQKCQPPYVNDAHISIKKYIDCVRTITSDVPEMPAYIMDINPNRGGGGGSNNLQNQQNTFINSLPYTVKEYLNENPLIKSVVLMYLANKQFSTESKVIATQLSILITNDTVLNSNNLLTELIVKQILFSNKYTLDEFEDFWSNLTNAQKEKINTYTNTYKSNNSLMQSTQTFLFYLFDYVTNNPNVDFDEIWYNRIDEINYTISDYDNNSIRNYDETIYQQFNPHKIGLIYLL